ncbi:hypothetical protein GPECTOR_35g833 [Gonium pectorale]|uniref:DEK-C domain-containing protein n=1 Tax=Gonium pectorale TaxID=33097 RepID=A0A150GCU1_GONPE|nr:hypothetical protein GPECTOR_35g833 [Gonium pectorale]|eukprot:KXZ47395.1 hypothetical protein GPECTOR_35g833 [Gonium pectorale]
MADDSKPTEVEAAPAAAEDEPKSAKQSRKSNTLEPAAVLSGPRQRKKADHFQVEVKEKPDFVIKPGKGNKLGEIPNVHFLLGKLKTDDELLTGLHSLLFKRPGTTMRRRKNLYEFSGLTFEEGDQAKEMEKLSEKLGKWTIGLLNSALDVFELPRGQGDEGKKEAKVERLLKFLEEPKRMSDKDLVAAAAKKKEAVAKKKEKAAKAKTPKSASKGGKKGQESSKKRSKMSEDDEEEEEQSEEAEEEPEEEPEPPKKKARKSEAKSEASPAKKKARKSETKSGASPAKKARKSEAKSEASPAKKKARKSEATSEASPAKKKAEKKAPSAKKSTGKRKAEERKDEDKDEAGSDAVPSDEEIREATLAALAVHDVNNTTVRDILRVLNEKFGKDLSSKKLLVREIAVEFANSQAKGPADKADEGGNDGAKAGGSEPSEEEPKAEEAAAADMPEEQDASDEPKPGADEKASPEDATVAQEEPAKEAEEAAEAAAEPQKVSEEPKEVEEVKEEAPKEGQDADMEEAKESAE